MDLEAQAEAASESAPPSLPPSTLSAQRRAAALSPWNDSLHNILGEWAMTAPPLETLALVRHKPEAPHRLPANVRFMIMGWCRGRGIPENAFYDWVFQGKEDTHARRARYGNDWYRWEPKRLPNDFKMLLVLQALYPDVILTNKHDRVYKQAHTLATTRLVTGLSF